MSIRGTSLPLVSLNGKLLAEAELLEKEIGKFTAAAASRRS